MTPASTASKIDDVSQWTFEAMESRKGQVGKRDREMGRLSEAIQGSKFDRPKELVVSRVLYDQLTLVSLKRPGSASTGMSRRPAHPDLTDGAGGFLPGVTSDLGCLGMEGRTTHPTAARIEIPAR
jgi:hypothetical protein